MPNDEQKYEIELDGVDAATVEAQAEARGITPSRMVAVIVEREIDRLLAESFDGVSKTPRESQRAKTLN